MEQFQNNHLNKNPLVSIIVLTYNTANYVIETLESIKAQTYNNIELLISDDCSTDDTVAICRKWIRENGIRFVKTELITSSENTGIPGSCNRGISCARGEWVKILASDDILMRTAIGHVVDFIITNKEVKILDSKVDIYNADLSLKIGSFDFHNSGFHSVNVTAKEQLKLFIQNLDKQRVITTLGVFVKRELIESVGGFDKRYRLLEDAPMWYKVLKSDNKFYYLNEVTTKYRRHENSISYPGGIQNKEKLVSDFKLTVDQFIWDNLLKSSDFINKLNIIWLRAFSKLVILFGNKGWFASMILKMGSFAQPIRLLWFQRTINKVFRTGQS